MARWALYILILLNLAAFLWFYNQTPVVDDKQNTISPKLHNSERIKLVKPDLSKPELQSQRESQPEPQSSTEGLTENAVDGNIDEATLIKLPEPKEPIVEDSPNLPTETVEAEIIELKPSESKIVKSEKVQPNAIETKPPIEKIVLEKKSDDVPVEKKPVVSEVITPPKVTTASKLSAEEQQLLAEMAAYAEAEPGAEITDLDPVQVCYQYGPLNNKQADALTSDFHDQDIPVVQQSRIMTKDAGFLVMISPLASEVQANQQVQRVKNAGLDAFTITKGEWLHGISLGIFSSKANANKLFNKAKKLLPNNSVELKPRFREVSVFRLIFSLDQSQDPDKLLATIDFPSIDVNNPPKLAKKSCESVEF